ncbi:MAG TPA: ABC-type transport auxiliary lipoprotein family protein [Burkholderiales bacterium]
MKSAIVLMFSVLIAAGCATTREAAQQTYDFGPVGEPPQVTNSVQIVEMRAPEWLDGSQMLYRLAYVDPRALTPYSTSRWAGTPASMLTLRLRQQLGSVPGAKCILTSNLAEFSQAFDAADASRAVLQVHAVLAAGAAGQRMQKDFRLEAKAATADAAGGAAAFATLATDLAKALDEWMTGSGLCAQS